MKDKHISTLYSHLARQLTKFIEQPEELTDAAVVRLVGKVEEVNHYSGANGADLQFFRQAFWILQLVQFLGEPFKVALANFILLAALQSGKRFLDEDS